MKKKLRMIIGTIAAVLGVLYLLLCGFLYLNQERFLFHPTSLPSDYAYTFSHRFEEIDLPVDGATINVVRFLADDPKGVILYVHGNGDLIAFLEPIAAVFVELGYDVVIPDYRGYGKSTGQITNEADLHADMEVVYQYVLGLYNEDTVTIYGQSIGTGLSVVLATEHSPKQLFLESPYFSMVDLVQGHVPIVPSFLLRYQLRSDRLIGQVRSPVYVLHGGTDTLIPPDHGERLYDLVQTEKEFFLVPDLGHSLLIGDARVQAFLARVLQ